MTLPSTKDVDMVTCPARTLCKAAYAMFGDDEEWLSDCRAEKDRAVQSVL